MAYMNVVLDSFLEKRLREVSKVEFKTTDEVIIESITKYADDVLNIKRYKKQLAVEFLENKIMFDDFARIVGYDNAKELLVAKETLKESIENAKKDFKDQSGD